MPNDFGPESSELLWKTVLPGSGVSSPIVSDGRVFVTAAYEGEERSRVRGATVGAMFAFAALAGVALVLRARRRLPQALDMPRWMRALWALDGFAVGATSIGFVAIALVAAWNPDRLWGSGIPGDAWLMTGTVGLAGLVAAFGCFPPSSSVRSVGAVVLVASGFFALVELPLNKHREVYKLAYRAVLVAPAFAGAAWFLLLLVLSRRRPNLRVGGPAILACAALGLMAVTLFVASNLLSPRAGLVRALLCVDLDSGDLLWNTPLFVAPEERLHRQNSFATPTACTDGERVFAFFAHGYACVDMDGDVLWEGRNEMSRDASRYGSVSSPIEFEDLFIVNNESEQNLRPSYIVAFDQETGEERWRVEPEFAKDSYMTPSLVPVGDSLQLVTVSMATAAAYDPRTGETLWTLALPTWQHVPGVTYRDDLLFISGGAHRKWVTAVLRMSDVVGATPEIVWQNNKSVPSSSSPVLYDDVYVMATNAGIMSCYAPETGELLWKERIDGAVLASLVAADGHILVCTEEGGIFKLRAGPEFEVVSSSHLNETLRATPAFANGRVLIRSEHHLYCFEAD